MRILGQRPAVALTGILFALVGLVLAGGGAWLAYLGGTWAYLAIGAATLATGLLLLAGSAAAFPVFALAIVGTLAWAFLENGLAWWPMAARGDVIFLMGAWLVILGFLWPGRWMATAGTVAIALIVAGAAGVAAMVSGPEDLAGSLPTAASSAVPENRGGVADGDWGAYGRSNLGDRWSPLTEITPENVGQLQVAWHYHTGDLPQPGDPGETTFELTPLKIGDRVYICTPHDYAIALDAETGREIWRYDPKITVLSNLQHLTCRGVSYHTSANGGAAAGDGECPERIFLPTADARLIALDAATGKPCAGFGNAGAVDLWQGMPDPEEHAGMYYSTSPPVVTKQLVIIAGEVTDNFSTDEPSGVIRAYDVTTGRLVWNFDPGRPDRTEPIGPGEHYTRNSPNSWIVSSADEDLGLLYVPLGNPTPDQFGGARTPEMERFSSSIVALEIATGKLRWVYQTVHHDLWDMDVPAQPSLVDLDTATGKVPALVQPTKRGDIYVLDRRTGEPIVPAPEKAVPGGAAAGDRSSPTQPFSRLTLLRPPLREADMWGATLFDQLACRIQFKRLRYEGIFTPPSTRGTLVYPGNFGIIDWGGIAVDPVRQVAFANPSYFAFTSKLIPRAGEKAAGDGAETPNSGSDLQTSDETGTNPMHGAPYSVDMGPLVSPIGLPCQQPPWGYVAGLDLKSGTLVYRRKNGTVRDQSPVPLPFEMGVPSLGGPIMTAGGVAFLTSTLDYYIRGYDVTTGEELWRARLPAGGQATPITYRSPSGRQMVLAMAGGHGSLGTKTGDSIIAYALPR